MGGPPYQTRQQSKKDYTKSTGHSQKNKNMHFVVRTYSPHHVTSSAIMITSPPPSRYTVKMLLNHEFFAEGVKIEALSHQGDETEDSPLLHLRMEVPTKEVSRKNNQESIEFTYDLDKDQPEVVISKMVSLVRSCLEKMVAIFAPIFFSL